MSLFNWFGLPEEFDDALVYADRGMRYPDDEMDDTTIPDEIDEDD